MVKNRVISHPAQVPQDNKLHNMKVAILVTDGFEHVALHPRYLSPSPAPAGAFPIEKPPEQDLANGLPCASLESLHPWHQGCQTIRFSSAKSMTCIAGL